MRWTKISLVAVYGVMACVNGTGIEATYAAALDGNKVVPPVVTTGFGTFTGELHEDDFLSYDISFAALGSLSTAAHMHGPANTSQTAGILVDFQAPGVGRTISLGTSAGAGSGTIDLTTFVNVTVSGDSLRRLLNAGLVYVDVHSTSNPDGEIRGQIRGR